MATIRLDAEEKIPLNTQEYLSFRVGRETFALPVVDAREIEKPIPFTLVPNVDDFVEGVFNLRGKIIPLMDLGKRLTLGPKKITSESRIVIAESGHRLVGMVVDAVLGVISINMDDLSPAPEVVQAKIAGEFITAVSQSDKNLIILLDIKKLLEE